MPNRTLLAYVLCFVLGILLMPYRASGQTAAQQAVKRLVDSPGLENASVAVDVVALTSGKRIAAHDPDRALIPASTLKLLSTGVALRLLGANSTFTTYLYASGPIRDGLLEGDIYLVGEGDPSLASDQLEGSKSAEELLAIWVTAIQRAGIKAIRGAVIADDSYFGTDGVAMGWPWADLGNYYGAGAYGLNWHENYYYLDFVQRQTEGSRPSVVRTRPTIPALQFRNEVSVGPRGSGDNAYIYGAPFNYLNHIRGTIPAGTGEFTIKGAIPDPALFIAQSLTDQLRAANIKVGAPPTSSRIATQTYVGGGQLLQQHKSPALKQLVNRTNQRSINLYAEALLRKINKTQGLPNTELASTKGLLQYLEETMQLSAKGVRLEDGSGLSTRNFFPPAFMTAFLQEMADDADFLQSIPLAGKTGSMRNVLKGTKAEGKLYAKSGTVAAVRCFAGYATTESGQKLAFSVMVNNHSLSGAAINKLLYTFMRQLCELP